MSAAPETTGDRAVEAGRGALFIGFAKGFFMLSGFLQRWLLTHFVGAAEYGAFSLVNNAVSTVNNSIVQGTIQWVSKFTAEDDARAEAVKRAGLVQQAFVGGGVGLGFFLAAPLIARGMNAPGYVPWLRMVAAIPLIYAFYSVFVGSANGQRRFRLQASFDVGFSTLKTVLLLGGALAGRAIGHSVTGAFLGFTPSVRREVPSASRPDGSSSSRWGSPPTPCSSTWPSTPTTCCCGDSPAPPWRRSAPIRWAATTRRCATSRSCPTRRCW
jgi:hypothetical protein